jgi:hypothetical protein
MLLCELRTRFPWGVLLVTDAASKEQIPSWATDDDQVAHAETALVVRVMHEDEGEVAVRVWDDPSDATGEIAFSGSLAVPTHTLRVSDALGEHAVEIAVPSGRAELDIFTDDAAQASEVNPVISPSSLQLPLG